MTIIKKLTKPKYNSNKYLSSMYFRKYYEYFIAKIAANVMKRQNCISGFQRFG